LWESALSPSLFPEFVLVLVLVLVLERRSRVLSINSMRSPLRDSLEDEDEDEDEPLRA